MLKRIYPFLFLFLLPFPLISQGIREYMDLQMHPTMHMVYGFFGEGFQYFDENDPPKLSYKHQLKNVNYANFWDHNPGARIIVNGNLCPEYIPSRKRAKKLILAQIQWINEFAETNSDRFVVARNPQEVRDAVLNTDKTVIIHSIEGGKKLINGPEDAQFWADQGIAFITLIHLVDDEFGGAAIRPEAVTKMINYKGSWRKVFNKKHPRGLTEKGKQAIQWLTDAGVMTDLAHMSDQSRKDAIAYMEEHNIPPLVTHDMFKPIQNQPRGIDTLDILRIYDLGGMISLPVSGISLTERESFEPYKEKLAQQERYCPGSIDSYIFTYNELQAFLKRNMEKDWGQMEESEKVEWAVGFQSDFNGWLNHSRPRFGKDGCFESEEGKDYEPIETEGLAHPGLLDSQWKLMEKEGVDLDPVKRASERFLQLWQHFLDNKK